MISRLPNTTPALASFSLDTVSDSILHPKASANETTVLMQVPSNLLVSKIRYPAVYICAAVAVWGAISACTAAVNSFGSLVACRFMLGFVEAVFFPGAFYFLSVFYSRQQIAFRTAILYSGSQLGNAFGTMLAIGIMELDGKHGLEGWRW